MIATLAAPTARTAHATKCSRAWQDEQWLRWPTPAHWPGSLDLYEAAAFRRVHPDTLRRATVAGRDGKARLKHQRLGTSIRVEKAVVEKFGVVEARA